MKAYERIEKPENWTQNTFARKKSGERVYVSHPEAVCFCAEGAIVRCYGSDDSESAPTQKLANALKGIVAVSGNQNPIALWNDAPGRTHAEVYNLLKSLDI